MSYTQLEHTADVGIRVGATDLERLFADALRGLTDVMTEVERVEPQLEERIELEAEAFDLLLVDWLSEAVYLFETRGLIFSEAQVELSETARGVHLRAAVRGEAHDPERHPHRVAIKAVTYHGLTLEPSDEGWLATVIFDI